MTHLETIRDKKEPIQELNKKCPKIGQRSRMLLFLASRVSPIMTQAKRKCRG